MRNQIYVVVPQFGKVPNYFEYYLESVKINLDILKIVFITDLDMSEYTLPQNFLVHNISAAELRLMSKNFLDCLFNIEFNIESLFKDSTSKDCYYKLCDFRPFYFNIFEKILLNLDIKVNDFIGFGDIDLIYGKLSTFLNNTENVDIISSAGHFTVIKNNPVLINSHLDFKYFVDSSKELLEYFNKESYGSVNSLYEALLCSRSLCIDEHIYIRRFLPMCMKKHNFKLYQLWPDVCDVIPPKPNEQEMSANFNRMQQDVKECVFKQNKLMIKTSKEWREAAYIHLQKRQLKVNTPASSFRIINNEFLPLTTFDTSLT